MTYIMAPSFLSFDPCGPGGVREKPFDSGVEAVGVEPTGLSFADPSGEPAAPTFSYFFALLALHALIYLFRSSGARRHDAKNLPFATR